MVVFMSAYASYTIVEAIHFAVVISLLVSGILLGNYGWYNLS